jgi:molybdopterin molybdotransferase
MKTLDEALGLVLGREVHLQSERVMLKEAAGLVLAEDVFSDTDMPPFDKSAVDGYACRQKDINEILEVIEFIPAGKSPDKKIGPGQCSKIMTGGVVPSGADMVIMVENTVEVGEQKIQLTNKSLKSNICYIGEDVKNGQKVLSKGTLLKPQHLAILASAGYAFPLVYKVPSVGIIVTGNELVEPDTKPDDSKIRNSNAYQLIAQLGRIHISPQYFGILEDSKEKLKETVAESVKENNLTIITGGASQGDLDFVPVVLEELGMQPLFNKVAIQPGKPVSFASGNGKFCFGLSGNPVSSFLQFELLVKPFIYKLMGYTFHPLHIVCSLAETKTRKKAERLQFFPVKINNEGKAEVIEFHGSAHIGALAEADGLVAFPVGTDVLEKNTRVNVRQI